MEEDTLYDRIGEADLNPTYKDGQVYQHTDVNNMLSILKAAVNENYHDISPYTLSPYTFWCLKSEWLLPKRK